MTTNSCNLKTTFYITYEVRLHAVKNDQETPECIQRKLQVPLTEEGDRKSAPIDSGYIDAPIISKILD